MVFRTVKQHSSLHGHSRLLGLVKELEYSSSYAHGDPHNDALTHPYHGKMTNSLYLNIIQEAVDTLTTYRVFLPMKRCIKQVIGCFLKL